MCTGVRAHARVCTRSQAGARRLLLPPRRPAAALPSCIFPCPPFEPVLPKGPLLPAPATVRIAMSASLATKQGSPRPDSRGSGPQSTRFPTTTVPHLSPRGPFPRTLTSPSQAAAPKPALHPCAPGMGRLRRGCKVDCLRIPNYK